MRPAVWRDYNTGPSLLFLLNLSVERGLRSRGQSWRGVTPKVSVEETLPLLDQVTGDGRASLRERAGVHPGHTQTGELTVRPDPRGAAPSSRPAPHSTETCAPEKLGRHSGESSCAQPTRLHSQGAGRTAADGSGVWLPPRERRLHLSPVNSQEQYLPPRRGDSSEQKHCRSPKPGGLPQGERAPGSPTIHPTSAPALRSFREDHF